MPHWLSKVGQWFNERLGLGDALMPMLTHPVPRKAGWWYVFGSATLTLFLVQVFTGIFLAMVYVPSADEAYSCLEYLNFEQPLGWFLRALHFWAATGMVVMLVVHMTQVFLFAAYKYPRELTWLVGVVLFALTLGMSFSGQVLRWDQDAYWGVGVAASGAGRLPLIGPLVVRGLLGGPIIGGETLSRFFALHVFILPALIFLFLGLHLYLVLKKGISEPPVPGQAVDPKTYHEKYEALLKTDGVPFFPVPVYRDAIFSALAVLVVVVVAAIAGPYGPGGPPDPTLTHTNPRPDWYFLSMFGLMALCPPEWEAVAMLGIPPAILLILALVPFVAGKGERAPSCRPVAVLTVILLYLAYGVFTWLGIRSPWSPEMNAWSGMPVPENLLKGRTPLQFQGAVVVQNKDCRNCHALEGQGGQRGPDLTNVGARLTRDELVRQVIQGGGNMPAYGKQLSAAEVEALVSFLASLHGADRPAAAPSAPPPR
jgi:ubiquinol-cytochrome c reductase cytochrome b subunit